MADKSIYFVILYERQNKQCYYCKTFLWDGSSAIACNLDHKTPTSRGGKNLLANLCLTCFPCNTMKANMTEDEFLPVFEKYLQGKITKKDMGQYAHYLALKRKFDI